MMLMVDADVDVDVSPDGVRRWTQQQQAPFKPMLVVGWSLVFMFFHNAIIIIIIGQRDET